MNTQKTIAEWREFVSGCLDFRPEEGVYRIARDMFTEPELFDLEMEMIFEKNWIYACHESEIANPNDFVTMRAGRQPMIITRDSNGGLNALVNACQHRRSHLMVQLNATETQATSAFKKVFQTRKVAHRPHG